MNGTDVTSSHEPSYYEIALTNRQVVVAFVILLVCLVTAFFSGVWIGRESAVRGDEQVARQTAPAQERQEGQALEELEFFDQPQGKAQEPAAEPEPEPPSRDTTLLEDLGGEDEAEQAGDAGDTGDTGDSETEPAAPPAQDRQAKAAPPEPARDESTVVPRPLPEATPAAGQVVIQVFSSSEQGQAERIRTRLVGGGHRAFLSPVEVAGRTMYRVRIGPFASRQEAQRVAEQVRKGYKLDTWVTE
jgi:DedD protein